jgi:hypothetical protein
MRDYTKEIGKKYGMLTIKEIRLSSRTEVLCVCDCGNEKYIRFDHLVRKGEATVSCGCYKAKNLTSSKTGSEHPFYTGTYPEQKAKRKTEEYKKWRVAVFERDNYTCQNEQCNHTCYILNAHHIYPFKDCYEDDEILYNIDNGITLCEECHREYHKRNI